MKCISPVPVAFLLLLAHASPASASCSNAQVGAVRVCYAAFFARFNFTAFPRYSDYMAAHKAIIQEEGIEGEKRVCEWVNARQACITAAHASGCTDIRHWMQALRLSEDDSYGFLSDFGVENYECTEGYDQLVRNFDCMTTVASLHHHEIKVCADRFAVAMEKEFHCSEVAEYINCFTAVYLKTCTVDGADFACNLAEIALNSVLSACALSNPVCPKRGDLGRFVGRRPSL